MCAALPTLFPGDGCTTLSDQGKLHSTEPVASRPAVSIGKLAMHKKDIRGWGSHSAILVPFQAFAADHPSLWPWVTHALCTTTRCSRTPHPVQLSRTGTFSQSWLASLSRTFRVSPTACQREPGEANKEGRTQFRAWSRRLGTLHRRRRHAWPAHSPMPPASSCRVSQKRTWSHIKPLSLFPGGWGCCPPSMWERRNIWPV